MKRYKPRQKSVEKRFWEKVNFGFGEDACWTWKSTILLNCGYGVFSLNGSKVTAHRAFWKIHNGEIPDGLFVLHKCDNRSCVKPSHLYLGTQTDNMNDMWGRNRHSKENLGRYGNRKGEKNGKSKLTEKDVKTIRLKYENDDLGLDELSKEFEVQKPAIWKIVHRKTWKHV